MTEREREKRNHQIKHSGDSSTMIRERAGAEGKRSREGSPTLQSKNTQHLPSVKAKKKKRPWFLPTRHHPSISIIISSFSRLFSFFVALPPIDLPFPRDVSQQDFPRAGRDARGGNAPRVRFPILYFSAPLFIPVRRGKPRGSPPPPLARPRFNLVRSWGGEERRGGAENEKCVPREGRGSRGGGGYFLSVGETS
ncbi:uncharacterized protein K489DRAFT_215429 [Dissoconium aciculare CBS 342.82]|uniref:Uncharacterized protein n=1 Tax=Dissoconium aciculare CBS 342.82 TaxID=1314786 RepID=A0A6J3M3X1_9PEZI|nr:uncharacterized protein K489DRAFT_215429 [Dissoconium aciculare CBS 342.82]KAF1822736.1 hypothetical protein K489DRAFT_215429 [Dissoconium aciculare CBS 342.82]